MNIEPGKVYISEDSLDCFFMYVTRLSEDTIYGYRVSFWEDGVIAITEKEYDIDSFYEETDYQLSSSHSLIKKIFGGI